MKHLLLVLAFTLFAWGLSAQEGYQDVVYLKNGSIVRGMIIEQVPNESVKIQTADGSVFVYKMDEIQKITKELDAYNAQRPGYRGPRKAISFKDIAGYRGMAEIAYSIGTGENPSDRLEVSTSHGYQFGQHFYLGAGIGFQYHFDADDAIFLPVFIHFRGNLLKTNITPFLDFKVGYSFFDYQGFYLSPGLGCAFNPGWQGSGRIYLLLAYTLQKAKIDSYYRHYDINNNLAAFSIKFGFEF